MKPYCFIRGAVIWFCTFLIAALMIGSATPVAAAKKPKTNSQISFVPAARLSNDPLTRTGFEHFYNMEYDKAIDAFQRSLELHPDDPFANNHLLSAVLFKELYRIGALDSELYANDSFLKSKQFALDPATKTRIKELMDRSAALCEQRLKTDPSDVDALYARGVVRGMRSTYIGLVDKAWFGALRSAMGARRDHERVLELKPDYQDAKMIVGLHNYVLGSLSFPVKVAASLIGVSGNRSKGIEYLYAAANGGGEASVDAKVALSLFLRREQRYKEAIALVTSLVQAYPRNFLVSLELANLENAAGHPQEAIAAYRKLLASGHQGLYTNPRLEQAAFGLGEALRGQRDFKGAAEAYETVETYPKVDPELQEKAFLAAGEMYDVLQNREVALKKYQAVIAADGGSWRAGVARKRLKEPYKPPKG
jgi:tetratricopeptide (TPR) repeat protein